MLELDDVIRDGSHVGIVRCDDERDAARDEPLQDREDVDGGIGVELGGRFVGDHDLRADRKRERKRRALLLTAGELARYRPRRCSSPSSGSITRASSPSLSAAASARCSSSVRYEMKLSAGRWKT